MAKRPAEELETRRVARKLFDGSDVTTIRRTAKPVVQSRVDCRRPTVATSRPVPRPPLTSLTNSRAGPASRPVSVRPLVSLPPQRQKPAPTEKLKAALTKLQEDLSTERSLREAEQARCLSFRDQLDASIRDNQRLIVELQTARDEIKRQEELAQLHILERRKLHNTIQELKGNIRVFARVRGGSQATDCFSFPDPLDGRAIDVVGPVTTSATGREEKKTQSFSFDKVFPPTSGQEEIFAEISQLVQSALDGYRVCIFAYGQTGSGKTYTMEGPGERGMGMVSSERGVIPRAVQQVVATSRAMKAQGWDFQLEAQFLEIYNDELRDLLAPPGDYDKRVKVTPKGGEKLQCAAPRHEIKHELDGRTTVTNVTVVPVLDESTVLHCLQTAARNRSSASTKMNERSSRSHHVFSLRITGTNVQSSHSIYGELNLIDLAGSERLNASGASGDRLKETQHINSSLSALSNVISALASKSKHVPYRDCKLTFLLQNALGGDGKTLMFVNLSPDTEHVKETLCSLRFAAKVNSCEIGTARKRQT